MPDAIDPLANPSARLDAVYRAVAARMRGLNVYNPALEVEAVGFAPWEGTWLGVMLTPWFMNLVLLPRDPARWIAPGDRGEAALRFSGRRIRIRRRHDEAIGDFQVCSLFSPLHEFTDHPTARLVATLAREALFDPANAESPETPSAQLTPATSGPGPLAQIEARLDAPMSKRDFLRARFIANDDGDRR